MDDFVTVQASPTCTALIVENVTEAIHPAHRIAFFMAGCATVHTNLPCLLWQA